MIQTMICPSCGAPTSSEAGFCEYCGCAFLRVDRYEDYEDCVDAVDLGLSVKWASCNLDADCPEDCGSHYAYGELKSKDNYSEENSTYNPDDDFGTVETLPLSADVAHNKLGGHWRMPTTEEFEELRDNCVWQWREYKGVNGYEVMSRRTGRSIFLPAAGVWYYSNYRDLGIGGYYWSSSPDDADSDSANALDFDEFGVDTGDDTRFSGRSVRPVLDDK